MFISMINLIDSTCTSVGLVPTITVLMFSHYLTQADVHSKEQHS